MIAPQRDLSVLIPEPALAKDLPRFPGIRRISDPSEYLNGLDTFVFVVVSLLELPSVADFVRAANQRHHLRGLFVRDDRNSNLLPQILTRANLRTVRSLVLYADPIVPERALRAFRIGAEDSLIADARMVDDRFFLIACSGETFELGMDDHPALQGIPAPLRHRFVVASDGAYVHWPEPDVHLDLEDARVFLDPAERERVAAKRAQANARFGETMAAYRRRHGLRQRDVSGVSERQIRRYERGAYVPIASLRLLAKAHGSTLEEYLDDLARESFKG